ncbi:MAG: hypothetical protein E7200_02850 [Selenomonas ruminantium]|nr:hypothetical protein [Selenomonas ruminantium]
MNLSVCLVLFGFILPYSHIIQHDKRKSNTKIGIFSFVFCFVVVLSLCPANEPPDKKTRQEYKHTLGVLLTESIPIPDACG